jgi:hypothetical protein
LTAQEYQKFITLPESKIYWKPENERK